MTRQTMFDVGSDVANIIFAFLVRNALVLIGLTAVMLMALR